MILAPAECLGTYLGDRDALRCERIDVRRCLSEPTKTIPNPTTTTLPVDTGVCCLESIGRGRVGNNCAIRTTEQCDGLYLRDSNNTFCTPQDELDCDAALGLGPCCISRTCALTARDACPGVFIGDRTGTNVCLREEQAICAGLTTTTTTAPVPTTTLPPEPTGGCCQRGLCIITTEASCRGT